MESKRRLILDLNLFIYSHLYNLIFLLINVFISIL
jgi:hypothetical protein